MTFGILTIQLMSGIIVYLLGSLIGKKGGKIIILNTLGVSLILYLWELTRWVREGGYKIKIREWFEIGMLKGGLELIVDKESVMMCILITTITLVVIGYSQWYMKEEEQINIFISQLMVFAVGMELFVSSKSYLVSFLGWEVIGVMSFTLINFWSNSIQNNKSALKAIIFNKVGDLLYIIALGFLFFFFNSTSYPSISSNLGPTTLTLNTDLREWGIGKGEMYEGWLGVITLLLVIAAMAKSAQIFLHCWLGDAMAGPTPVSALLHAATMVTAGVYLLIRSSFLFNHSDTLSTLVDRVESVGGIEEERIRIIIINIGLLTIIFAGLVSLNQYDIKKIIAYSTCSQIGYMFISIVLVSPDTGSLYHLITHAFAKALLFISGGVLIHSYWGEQDIRKFGGLIDKTPSLFLFFLIGSLSLIGIPGFSGFFSKELIILQSGEFEGFEVERSTRVLLIIGSLLTSLYCLRLIYYLFFRKPLYFNHLQTNFKLLLFNTRSDNLLLFLFFSTLLFGCFFIGYSSYFFFVFPNYFNLDPILPLFNPSTHPSTHHTTHISFGDVGGEGEGIVTTLFFLPLIGVIFLSTYYLFPRVRSFSIFYRSLYSYFISKFFHTIFNSKLFFDSFYNYLFVNSSFSLSYQLFFKVLERGFIENLFILAPSRLLNYFYTHFSFFRLSFHNLSTPLSFVPFVLSILLDSLTSLFIFLFSILFVLWVSFSLPFLPLVL